MCSCHSILECCVTFSGVKLSIKSFVLLFRHHLVATITLSKFDVLLISLYLSYARVLSNHI